MKNGASIRSILCGKTMSLCSTRLKYANKTSKIRTAKIGGPREAKRTRASLQVKAIIFERVKSQGGGRLENYVRVMDGVKGP